MKNKKNILREAGVLLVVAILVLTALVMVPTAVATSILVNNGEPDGRNALAGSYYYENSNIIIDDFQNGEDWTITGGHLHFIWSSGSTANMDKVRVYFFEDLGGCVPSLVDPGCIECNTFTETATDNYYFSRPEIIVDFTLDSPITIPAGEWYVGIQPDGINEDLAYLLTASYNGCEIMADLPYWGYPRWTSGHDLWGDYFDLAWELHGSSGPINNPPYDPRDPVPENEETGVSACNTRLYWIGGDPDYPPDFATYEIYLEADDPTPDVRVASGLLNDDIPYDPSPLISGTTYYWQIVSTDTNGATTEGDIWWFKTETCEYLDLTNIWVDDNKWVKAKIQNSHLSDNIKAEVTMTFTVTGGPCGCVSPELISSDLTETSPGIYEKVWTNVNIGSEDEKEKKVEITGGCACFDVTVTVNSCGDPIHHCVIQDTRHGCICDLTLC